MEKHSLQNREMKFITPPLKSRRPFSVTLLAVGVLIVTGFYLVRLLQAVFEWRFLSAVLPFSPLYLALTGLVWALTGLALFWGLWRGYRWAPRYLRWAFLAHLGYFWIDRLFFVQYSGRWINWPFTAGAFIVLFFLMVWILSRPRAVDFFSN